VQGNDVIILVSSAQHGTVGNRNLDENVVSCWLAARLATIKLLLLLPPFFDVPVCSNLHHHHVALQHMQAKISGSSWLLR
jgi:hypothetical protein